MECRVEKATDDVWEAVEKYLPLEEMRWPPWAAPLVHAKQRARDRYAARRAEACPPQVPPPSSSAALSTPATPSAPPFIRPRRKWKVEVVIKTRPKRKSSGDPPDTSSAKRRKCDRCAARPEECACVLREGAKNCNRCMVDKKGCRIGGESYSEWFDSAGLSRGESTHSWRTFGVF